MKSASIFLQALLWMRTCSFELLATAKQIVNTEVFEAAGPDWQQSTTAFTAYITTCSSVFSRSVFFLQVLSYCRNKPNWPPCKDSTSLFRQVADDQCLMRLLHCVLFLVMLTAFLVSKFWYFKSRFTSSVHVLARLPPLLFPSMWQ